MKRSALSLHATRMAVLALAIGSLAGCESLNDVLAPDHVNYKDTPSAPPLTVPQDLSSAPTEQKYVAPPPQAGLGNAPKGTVTSAGNTTLGTPTAQDPLGMHIERDGDRRWLVIDGRTPDDVWPILQTFWQENGFALATDSSSTGIMTTGWAENRANIPDDWFRRTIGRVIDFAYSSGTRDRFRTLVTRGADGQTDISITHSAMEEMLTGQEKTGSKWVERPRDPALEALFLSKLMQKFGLTDAQSKQLLTDARTSTVVAKIDNTAGGATLDLPESFDRAWLRVGLALDRTNFTVDNRDRAKGIYYVRYADSMQELKGDGLLGKLFYSPKSAAKNQGAEFLIAVRAKSDVQTQIAVLDQNGQVDTSTQAQRIVTALHAQLN
ncbi:MAG: outer membrane protein assembly factor BamC [Paraburkholderia sp.]|uniref:outer membrane protein assembly factor BamC n=1 Tax=Paraburkholderia sp. TaxID=1926495 RepID=UPI0011F8A4D6|nr:outer membrane protein assembly factor BamC [Paraburkholderia sp.]TAM07087.1 MAG: outer membrane protein assembly factor BamC [Paraburkholderia sp.]TAM32545.1 MAG: outer membrane protein assembly factor BamC [Paraburkholderia sp.]